MGESFLPTHWGDAGDEIGRTLQAEVDQDTREPAVGEEAAGEEGERKAGHCGQVNKGCNDRAPGHEEAEADLDPRHERHRSFGPSRAAAEVR